jgi:hypothetical protein
MKLYTVLEAVPSRIMGLANLINAIDGQGYTRAEIIDLLQPATFRKGADADPDMSNKVIGAARELGLIDEYENEQGERCMRLSAGVGPPANAESRTHWNRWIARRVLRDLVEGEARRLAIVFAWLMTIRLRDTPVDRAAWKGRFERDGFNLDEFGLKLDARWDNLFDWGRFLGLLWQTRADRDAPGVVADPSTLLTRFLVEILPTTEEVTVGEFRGRLGIEFPTLDGGHVFRNVRDRVAAARGESPELSDRLSPGVGMALRELRDRGLIAYHCPDDQRTFLMFEDGERIAFLSRRAGAL